MFIWRYTNKRRDRTKETRDGILHEIERAEQRNQLQKEAEQNHRENTPKAPEVPHHTQGTDIFSTVPVQNMQETPIIPSTPVSMQPAEKPRVRMQVGSVPQSVQPLTVRPMQPAAEPVQPETTEKANTQYDVDEILKEVREGRL